MFLFQPAFRPPRRPVHEIALGGLLREDLTRTPFTFTAPDPRVQNCAPAGLAVCRLRGGERVSLWNLHRHHELLEFDLPADTPRIMVELPGVGTREMEPLLHTVLIEPDDDRVTLAWAGSIDVAAPYPEEMTRTLRCAAIWADGRTDA
jgi:hypothetical protein